MVRATGLIAVSLEIIVTLSPPEGADPVNATDPVVDVPPAKVLGLNVIPESTAGVIARLLCVATPAKVAARTTFVELDTAVVVIGNVAVVAPAATVTVAGTEAAVTLEPRLTTFPPGPAGPRSVTVPIVEFPPTTVAGARVKLANGAGLTVKTTVLVTDPNVAVMVTGVVTETAEVAIVNCCEETWATTVAGTVITGELALTLTAAPL